jgi:hypothetical protein
MEMGGPWKHGPVEPQEGEPKLVICFKNPYAWLHSFYMWVTKGWRFDPTLKKWSGMKPNLKFPEFIDHKCYGFENPVTRYNAINTDYLGYLEDPKQAQAVRQEDMLTVDGQLATLKRIEKAFEFSRKDPHAILLKTQMNVVFVNQKVTVGKMHSNFYKQFGYLARFKGKPEILDKVNSQLDEKVLEGLGYCLYTDAGG